MFKFIKSQIAESKQKKLDKEIRKNAEEIRKEQEEIKNRKILEEKLKNIIINNSKEVTLLGVNLCTLHGLVKECTTTINIKIDEYIFYENFIDIYSLAKDVKSLEEFDNKINKVELQKILVKNFDKYINIRNNNSNINFLGNKVVKSEIANEMKQETLYLGNQTFDRVLEETINTLNGENNLEFCKISILWILLMYAVVFNRFLVILKYKQKFVQNKELYNITINLYNEKSKEFDNEEEVYFSVRNKLFYIYENFYSNVFDEKLKIEELGVLSYLICKASKYEELNLDNDVKNIVDKNKIYCSDIDQIISIIGKYFIGGEASFKYMYCSLINGCIEKIDVKELITIYSKLLKQMDKVNEIKKELALENERNRYLNNDFRIEEQIRDDRREFENIISGEGFELYLKKLYTKLGYKVELTKATGDQGADLILYKDGLKIVVQAKFYSSSVGNKAVQEVAGAIKFYDADYGVVVTNNLFTKSAIELADSNNIELIDKFKLNELRKKTYNN